MKKGILFAMAALFSVTLSFAQEYMIVENIAGGIARYDVSVIKQAYFKTYEASGMGTAENPFNVAAANAKAKEVGEEPSAAEYYVKGYVTYITRNYFYIADDMGGINRIYTEASIPGKYEIKEGDEVVICGSLYNYGKLTPRLTGQVTAINGQEIELPKPQGDGTKENPFNVAAAIAKCKEVGATASTETYYIKGVISSIREEFNTTYGNASFYISDDINATNALLAYRVLYLGNKKFTSDDPQIKEGDEIIIYGKLVNYNGITPETAQNQAYVYSHNGNTGENENNNPEGAKGTGTETDPFNVAAIINYVSSLPADVDTKQDYYIKGIITEIPQNGISTHYNNLTFYISDDAAGNNKFYIYRAKGLNGNDVTEDMIKVGDEVVIFSSTWVNYKGTTPETKQGAAYIVSISENANSNANKNTSGPAEAQSRYEFPKLKGENNVVVVHKSILNKNTNETGVNYSVEWDTAIRAQRWSCYQLYNSVNFKSSENVSRYYADNDGSLSPECQYPNDPDLPSQYQLTVDPYKGSGFDHGHICSSADRQRATECNYQTFFITNMQPQNNDFNAGIWATMEAQVRTWANNFDTLYVCKGGTIDNSNYIVKYLGSGNNKIPVPQYFYMAVLGKKGSTYKATGFWIDQSNHPSTSIKDYAVTIQELEEKTSIDFFCNLPDNIENSVETVSKSTMESQWNWAN